MVLPGCCILFDKVMDTLLGLLDYRRPFDNMAVGPGSPQDDEVPLVKLTPHAEYHKYSFPRHYRFWLDTYVFNFSSASPQYAQWKKVYLGTLKKAAVLMGKNRSLLKSPRQWPLEWCWAVPECEIYPYQAQLYSSAIADQPARPWCQVAHWNQWVMRKSGVRPLSV
jgi:hypothetical protein